MKMQFVYVALLTMICLCAGTIMSVIQPYLPTVSDEEGLDHVNQVIEAKFALPFALDKYDMLSL